MVEGNGAIIVHRQLEQALPRYKVIPYSPRFEYAPIFLGSLRFGKAKLIHTTPDHAIFHARKNIPLVVTFHNYVLDHFMQQHSTLVQRLYYRNNLRLFSSQALKRASIVTAVSRYTAELVYKDLGFAGDIKIIPNGIDARRFRPGSDKDKDKDKNFGIRILFSGNLTRRKGADLLPSIVRRLNPGIRIICTGGLRGKGRSLHDDRIEFIGYIPYEKMPSLYQSVHVLLKPTVREGFGLAVAEAMSCGLPVVATDCSTMPDLIHHGQGGYLCRLGNVDEFARYINKLARSPSLRARMGEYNRARVEKEYKHEEMIKRYRMLFEEVLGTE